jgi:hypothetical protein
MILRLFAITGIAFLLFGGINAREAYAYLDPGTGSYIFQIIIAFMIGGLYAVKLFWNKIIFFFRNLFLKIKK